MARYSKVALATGNKGKLAEFNKLLDLLAIQLAVGPKFVSPPEDGVTYFQNAAIKAKAGAAQWGVPCVGEDSGIEVVGLGDLPGPFSARFCTFSRNDIISGIKARSLVGFASNDVPAGSADQLNNDIILEMLKGKSGEERICRYVACIVLADPNGNIQYVNESSVWGRVLEAPKGQKGFGFDPIVEFFDFPGRSVAELSMEEKGLVSHRGKATHSLVTWLAATYA